jgi:hypothetical protein
MIHPIFRLIASQPQLLADHVEAYSELMAEDLGTASQAWRRRTMLHGICFGLAIVAVMLAGMALLLWGTLPMAAMPAPWVLWAVPGSVAALAAWAGISARAPQEHSSFQSVRAQLAADAAMLREVSTS